MGDISRLLTPYGPLCIGYPADYRLYTLFCTITAELIEIKRVIDGQRPSITLFIIMNGPVAVQ